MNFKVAHSVLCTLFLCVSSIAHAGLISFTDKVSFDSAAGATVLETFDAGNCCRTYITINSSTVAGIQSGASYSLLSPLTGRYPLIFDAGGGFDSSWLHSYNTVGTSALLINFDTTVSAFAFETNYYMGLGFTLQANNSDGTTSIESYTGLNNTLNFFGFTSDKNVTSIEILGNGDGGVGPNNFALDNFQFGGVAHTQVPEPSTLAIFALGLIGLASRRFKKQS